MSNKILFACLSCKETRELEVSKDAEIYCSFCGGGVRVIPVVPESLLIPLYYHRNNSSENPEIDGWYWCVWNYQDGTPDYETPIPVEWYQGAWWEDTSKFKGIPPDSWSGPIPFPKEFYSEG